MIGKMVADLMCRVCFLLMLLLLLITGMGCLPAVDRSPGEVSVETQPFPPDIDIAPLDLSCPQVILSPCSIKISHYSGWATINNLTDNKLLKYTDDDLDAQGRIYTTLKYTLKNKTNMPLKFTSKIKYGNREMDRKEIILTRNESKEISHEIYFLRSESIPHYPYKNLSISIPILRCPWPDPIVDNILFSACIAFNIEAM